MAPDEVLCGLKIYNTTIRVVNPTSDETVSWEENPRIIHKSLKHGPMEITNESDRVFNNNISGALAEERLNKGLINVEGDKKRVEKIKRAMGLAAITLSGGGMSIGFAAIAHDAYTAGIAGAATIAAAGWAVYSERKDQARKKKELHERELLEKVRRYENMSQSEISEACALLRQRIRSDYRDPHRKEQDDLYYYACSMGPSLFAPDTYVIGGGGENVYNIGPMLVDQTERAQHFWDEVGEIAQQAGFAEFAGGKNWGFSGLMMDILRQKQEDSNFNEQEKLAIGEAVVRLARSRRKITQSVHDTWKMKDATGRTANARKKYGIALLRSSSEKLEELKIKRQIQQYDAQLVESFRDFFDKLQDAETSATGRFLCRTYFEDAHLDGDQDDFLGELARGLVKSGVDVFDDSTRKAVKFIDDIPTIKGDSAIALPQIYEAFYDWCAQNGIRIAELNDFLLRRSK